MNGYNNKVEMSTSRSEDVLLLNMSINQPSESVPNELNYVKRQGLYTPGDELNVNSSYNEPSSVSMAAQSDRMLQPTAKDASFINIRNSSTSPANNRSHQFALSDNNFTINKDKFEESTLMNNNKLEPDVQLTNLNAEFTEEVHTVRLAINIVAAFPIGVEKDSNLNEASKTRVPEGPKPTNFYKFEYQLIPDDSETLYSFDLVTYKSAAKLFPDRADPRVIKAWEHENKLWITWNQSHELKLTKTKLLKLFDYEVVFKIWDSKDYCSPRTRFDKPKPFKFSKTGENSEDAIKQMIINQCENYLKQVPPELHDKLERKLPHQTKSPTPETTLELTDQMTNTLIAMPSNSVLSHSIANRLNELACDSEMNQNIKSRLNNESRMKSFSKLSKISSEMSNVDFKTPRQKKEKTRREIAAEQEFIKKNGINRIKLKMRVLFSGCRYFMSRLEQPMPTLEDCFVSVNLETSLMSEQQLYDLNPITIKIEKLTDMPNRPLSYEVLKEKCDRVYCSYSFFRQPMYKTTPTIHGRDVFFNDTNVYLAGLLNKEELSEFFHQSLFEIEIHDRDRKVEKNQPIKPCLFGNDVDDEQISNINSIASKHTLYNPFETKNKHWDSYGVARLNLHEFILGKKLIEYFIPVLPCSAPDVLGRNATKDSSNTKVLNDSDNRPLPAGAYLDTNTHLSVRISVAKPLFEEIPSRNRKSASSQQESSCPYGRLILNVDSANSKLIRTVIDIVRFINASTLHLDQYPISLQDAALSTYKLSEEEKQNKSLNVVRGFHLIDSKSNLFVLEGLAHFGIKFVFEKLPKDKSIEVLYNSNIKFSQCLYTELEVELLTIKLFEPLEEIVKKPLLYVRDMTPKSSFEALIKLNELLKENRLRNVVRLDLLPTSQMILSMSKEYGVPLTECELSNLRVSSVTNEPKNNIENANNMNETMDHDAGANFHTSRIPHTSRIWTPIDNYNNKFLEQKLNQDTPAKNFLLHNAEQIPKLSEQNRHKRPVKHYMIAESPYNYSSQTLNSTELTLKKFRDHLKQNDPNRLYSYNLAYHNSGTFVPVDVDELDKENKLASIQKWKTRNGWIYPGVKTGLESNEHPDKLDQASLDKINEPWEENHLHTYKMKSPLDRRFFPHIIQNKDFNVWSKPEEENIFPVTIFEAGDVKHSHEKEVAKSEKEKWKSKVIVENERIEVHRLAPATEQKISGLSSSNQLDKLKGLLKSEPKKKGLLTGGVNFNDVPAISSVKTSYAEEEKLNNNSKGYVAGSDNVSRITDFSNVIPVQANIRKPFTATKKKDFDNVTGPQRSPIYKKSIDLIDYEPSAYRLKSKIHIIPNASDLNLVKTYSQNSKISI